VFCGYGLDELGQDGQLRIDGGSWRELPDKTQAPQGSQNKLHLCFSLWMGGDLGEYRKELHAQALLNKGPLLDDVGGHDGIVNCSQVGHPSAYEARLAVKLRPGLLDKML
jgi:hypothetical protein